MKRIYILSPLVLIIGLTMLYSASGGVAAVQNKDRTGSPVSDQTCIRCHVSGISFIDSLSITVTDSSGNEITEYQPLYLYTLAVNINSRGATGHGFQLTGLLNDNTFAGLVPSVNSGQLSLLNDRWYFENNGVETGGKYTMTWRAPAANSGTVTFYGTALAVNGDGKTNGDDYENIPDLAITEAGVTGVSEVSVPISVKIYPNPVVSEVTVESAETIQNVIVYNVNGVRVREFTANTKQVNFDVHDLPKGIYVVNMTTQNGVVKSSFIKN